MMKLTKADLWSLEDYSNLRQGFRKTVIAHKKNRQLFLGEHATLYFEDSVTMKYQIQEMLRIEKIFESPAIEEELEAYNPLIPDGDNWKATFMIEFPDPAERATQLEELVGIEDKVWVGTDHENKIYAFTNEDLDRSREEKTAAVHFMRFQLDEKTIAEIKDNKPLMAGIDHPKMEYQTNVSEIIRLSLLNDLS
ncbi:DUF3501 family protein [Gammaproteobacteria bacterium]|nr:DUF3501 family protein [Gammaproteobacteria bacterium]